MSRAGQPDRAGSAKRILRIHVVTGQIRVVVLDDLGSAKRILRRSPVRGVGSSAGTQATVLAGPEGPRIWLGDPGAPRRIRRRARAMAAGKAVSRGSAGGAQKVSVWVPSSTVLGAVDVVAPHADHGSFPPPVSRTTRGPTPAVSLLAAASVRRTLVAQLVKRPARSKLGRHFFEERHTGWHLVGWNANQNTSRHTVPRPFLPQPALPAQAEGRDPHPPGDRRRRRPTLGPSVAEPRAAAVLPALPSPGGPGPRASTAGARRGGAWPLARHLVIAALAR